MRARTMIAPLAALATAGVLAVTAFGAPVAAPVAPAPAAANPSGPKAPWEQILGPAQGRIPEPLDKVVWRSDLPAAMADARAQNRPLFVTMRCIPCKQCAAFDKDVLEGGPNLDPLLKQFQTVRLTSAKDIDLRLLPVEAYQDLDLSWWGYLLSPEGRIYGVFGGRDEVSDETRISKAALIATLRRVLAHHYDPRRAGWDVDGPPPDLSGEPRTPVQLPGYAAWAKGRRFDPRTREAGCLHCHQVAEVLRQPAVDAGTLDKSHDLNVWPLPENVGVTLDRDDGLRVTRVAEGSAAARAGLRPGDALAAAGGRKLFGQADFRGVLHRGPRGAGAVPVLWLRDGKVMSAALDLPDGWRRTELGWRMSVSQGNVGVGPGFWPLPATAADRKRLEVAEGKLLVKVYVPSPQVKSAGLSGDSWIVAVDGRRPDLSGRAFLVWFRMSHELGDAVSLTVLDPPGKEKTIDYRTDKAGRGEE